MQRLSSLLQGVLRRRGLFEHAEASRVVHKANAWLTEKHPTLAPFAVARSLQDHVLSIECAHGVAQQELQHLSHDLCDALQRDGASPALRIRVVRA